MHELLNQIQQNIKVPKGQWNDFSKFKYRNCEDILKAVKPMLGDAVLTLSDEMVNLGDRFYVKSTAKLMKGNVSIEAHGFAREPLNKKGMDECQISGSASSYARKYALCGLFGIDDGVDSDSSDNRPQNNQPQKQDAKWFNDFDKQKNLMIKKIQSGEQTQQGIIDSLKKAGFCLSKDTEAKIKELK